MASRLSPNRSLGRLARTVKNIWTKSEMRRTSQPGSMIKCVLSRCFGNPGKFACYVGERHTRHIGPELVTPGMFSRRGGSAEPMLRNLQAPLPGATALIRGALLRATTQHALRMRARGSERRSRRLPVELSTVRVAAAHRVEERVRFGRDEVALVLLQPRLLLARQPRLFVGGRTTQD